MKHQPALSLRAVAEGAALHDELVKVRDIQRTLERSGLDKEAKKLNPKIYELNVAIGRKKDEALEQRRTLIRRLFLCFAAGDIATAAADATAETFRKITFGREREGGIDFARIFAEQAEAWNKCVQIVDGDGATDVRISNYYADMAEEITDTILPQINSIIDRYVDADKGVKIL